jgi:hypothetical protein
MELSVQDLVHRCVAEYARASTDLEQRKNWLLSWQGQAILVSSQQAWTEKVEMALAGVSPLKARSVQQALHKCREEGQLHLT